MTDFFGFGSSKPKPHKRYHSGPQPYPSQGYGYASAVNLHRPPPPPPPPRPNAYQAPQHWLSPPMQQPVYAQTTLQLPASTSYQPYQPVYGATPYKQDPPWASSTTLVPPSNLDGCAVSSHRRHMKTKSFADLGAAAMDSAVASVDTLVDVFDEVLGPADNLYGRMGLHLNRVITCMDEEQFSGKESELMLHHTQTDSLRTSKQNLTPKDKTKTNHFAKVWQYSNSRLPPYLPPVKLYLDTWPLLNLAARQSLSVYSKPAGHEKNDYIKGDRNLGTKAMQLKSMPIDDKNTIVFAIRGTSTFMDWSVNMKTDPKSPEGFLDDAENLAHAGFLQIAKAMVAPVAERLRHLLQEDPSRGLASLLITGHSAGGAVAQLLYAHMTSEFAQSELTHLVGFFKRVHCVTFGAPPVTLFPLQKPNRRDLKKSMFFAFANEGDPVVRADKTIVRSLLKLYAVPAPSDPCKVICPIVNSLAPGFVPPRLKKIRPKKSFKDLKTTLTTRDEEVIQPRWDIPASLLSLGGRILLMRPRYEGTGSDDLELCGVTDEMLRDVVYGDPMAHAMKLYARRVEILATRAATGYVG